MTTKNSKLLGRIILPGMITAVIAVMFLFSCKKSSVEKVSVKNDMVTAAKMIDGAVLSGTITSESDENEVALNYNNGNKLILITKIADAESININNMQSAEVITSKYGVIIKDVSTNKVFLLANNDLESIKKFEAVQSLFDKNFESATIFGITIVNSEKV
jgi:hypothetical protein